MDKSGDYISNIVLELQPRSRRGYRRLFGIRENRFFNEEFFDRDHFTRTFLNEFNQQALRRGQHIKCEQLIVAVKQIKRGRENSSENTQVEYRLRGLPFNEQRTISSIEEQGKLNQSFVADHRPKTTQGTIDGQIEQVYSCSCSECKKSFIDGDFFIKTSNWSRPILCLTCYELYFTPKCVRCNKSITFDHHSLTNDGLGSIRFVEENGLYWHSDCCVCVTCLDSLIGKNFYQDQFYHQLFCLDHIPYQL